MISKTEQRRINTVNKFNAWLRKHYPKDREFDQPAFTRLNNVAKTDGTTVHLSYKEYRNIFWRKGKI